LILKKIKCDFLMLMANKNTKTLLIEKDKIKNKYINNDISIHLFELYNND